LSAKALTYISKLFVGPWAIGEMARFESGQDLGFFDQHLQSEQDSDGGFFGATSTGIQTSLMKLK